MAVNGTQVTYESPPNEESVEYAIASYGDPFGESSDWTNEDGDPLNVEDWLNGALFHEDGTLTEHGMEMLASLEEQGAFL